MGAFVERGRERSEKRRLSISSFFKVRKKRMKIIGLGEISMSRMINAPEERDLRPSTGCLHKHSSVRAIAWVLDRGAMWPIGSPAKPAFLLLEVPAPRVIGQIAKARSSEEVVWGSCFRGFHPLGGARE